MSYNRGKSIAQLRQELFELRNSENKFVESLNDIEKLFYNDYLFPVVLLVMSVTSFSIGLLLGALL